MARETKTAPCIDCGQRVSKWLGASHRYPQGVRTTGGYICGPCMRKRHDRSASHKERHDG